MSLAEDYEGFLSEPDYDEKKKTDVQTAADDAV